MFSGNQIGSATLGRLGEDFAKFYSVHQFTLTLRDGDWYLRHNPAATNITDIDDAPAAAETKLHPGAVIAVGKTKKMPVTVTW